MGGRTDFTSCPRLFFQSLISIDRFACIIYGAAILSICLLSHTLRHILLHACPNRLPENSPVHSQTFENKSSFETNVFVFPFPVTPPPPPPVPVGALLHPPKSSSFVISGLDAFPVPIPSAPPPTPAEEPAPAQPKSPSAPTAGFGEDDGAGGDASVGCVIVMSLDCASQASVLPHGSKFELRLANVLVAGLEAGVC